MPICKHEFSGKQPTSHCELLADASGYCPLHNPDSEKNSAEFDKALAEVLHNKTRDRYDFRDTVFIQTTFFRAKTFDVYADFRGAKFLGDINFEETEFVGDSDFTGARFEKQARFHKTYFGPHATFTDSHFLGQTVFSNCRFMGKGTFSKCKFEKDTSFAGSNFNNTATFEYDTFFRELSFAGINTTNKFKLYCSVCRGDVSFEGATMNQPWCLDSVDFHGKLSMRKIASSVSAEWRKLTIHPQAEMTLAEASIGHSIGFIECRFLGRCKTMGWQYHHQIHFFDCELGGFELSPVLERVNLRNSHQTEWPRKKVLAVVPDRIMVSDEKGRDDTIKALRFFRELQKWAFDAGEYSLSSSAYISFMVMKRKTAKRRRLTCLLDWFYEKLSAYGESVVRPVVFLLLLWIICTTLLLNLGIELREGAGPTQRSILGDGEFFLTADFFQTFFLNFLLSTLLRVGESRPEAVSWQSLVVILETLANALLISFLYIGVRRHFNPKKPILDKELT